MNHVLRGSSAHVVVESLDAPSLDETDAHHLARVLRLQVDDVVTATDGNGSWVATRWTRDGGLQPIGEIIVGPPRRGLAVACAIAKGDRNELVVQKLTELGLDRIVLFEATRSVVRWDRERQARQLDRLRRIAREAAMQSRRVHLPEVVVADFAAVAQMAAVALAEPDADDRIGPSVSAVAVGPEGGFAPGELAQVERRVRLTDTILRVETAAIAAGAALVAAHT
ncbi:MAG: hypothetical protein RI958_1767 [Actinomycetota bacterium]